MPQPTIKPEWATDTNYTGGAEAGTPTKVEPTSGKKAEGWEPGEEPPAMSLNWWQNLVYLWVLFWAEAPRWLEMGNPTNSIEGTDFDFQASTFRALAAGSGAEAIYSLGLPVGTRIKSITVYGRAGNTGTEVLQAFIARVSTTGTVTQVSTTKTSSAANGATSIGWTVADTDFTPDGYTVIDEYHYVHVQLGTPSSDGEVAVYGIKVVPG